MQFASYLSATGFFTKNSILNSLKIKRVSEAVVFGIIHVNPKNQLTEKRRSRDTEVQKQSKIDEFCKVSKIN